MKISVDEPVVEWRHICVGIICLTLLELFALYKGINGFVLTAVIAIIATSIGVAIPANKLVKK